MENIITPMVNTSQCVSCQTPITADDAFCNNCGFPIQGTEQEQNDFWTQVTINDIDRADYHKKIKTAANCLYLIAAIFALWGIVSMFTLKDDPNVTGIAIANLVVCGIFVFLGSWSRKKPFAALVSGATLYAIVIILNAIDNPVTIFSGIIIKVLIIGALIKGIRAAMDADKLQNPSV